MTSGRWRVWVAESEPSTLIGSVWLQLVERVPRPDESPAGPIGYVTNVYVEPASRDAGLGAQLLDAVISEARSTTWR